MNPFFRFMVTRAGNMLRIVVGLTLIVVGISWVQGTTGWIMIFAGLVPLVASVFDKCILAALLSLPTDGSELRKNK